MAFLITGRAMRPVDVLIHDVSDITDGRSLHKRLPVSESEDELARLAATLNAMIGRLEQSFAALRRFTADASHELKTPLTVLRADIERAMASGPRSTDGAVALEEALQETARMADLVESLLTLARSDEGRFDLYREPVPLEPLVRDVAETAQILGEAAGLRVSLSPPEPVTVMGDPLRLRQLFLNLVTNAVKYTGKGGKVELSLVRRGDSWSSRWPTRALASPVPTCRTSSTASGARTGRARARSSGAAWGWACRSASGSPTPTAARSPWRRASGADRRSRSRCRAGAVRRDGPHRIVTRR